MILFIPSPQSKTKPCVVRGVRHKVELSWMQEDEKLQIPELGGRGSPWGRTMVTPNVLACPQSLGRAGNDRV